MGTAKFKTIILFSPRNENTTVFRVQLDSINYIKIFETSIVDEVQQIVDQSERAIILVDDEVAANKIFKATINKKVARFKKYYINWFNTMGKSIQQELFEQNFTVINSEDVHTVIERIELYFFGKTKIFDNAQPPVDTDRDKKSHLKKGYFTHLEKRENGWKVITSSHEAEDEINTILGKNWDMYLDDTLSIVPGLKTFSEVRLDAAPFHEIVYPHFKDGKMKRISIVHVSIDGDFVDNIMNVQKFLETMPIE